MQNKEQEIFKKRIIQGDQNNRFTSCHETRTIFSLSKPSDKYDSKIDKQTALDYFHRVRAYETIVPNKSYAQAVKSAPSISKYVKQLSRDSVDLLVVGESINSMYQFVTMQPLMKNQMGQEQLVLVCTHYITDFKCLIHSTTCIKHLTR